jgi:hypothetical protein
MRRVCKTKVIPHFEGIFKPNRVPEIPLRDLPSHVFSIEKEE